MSFIPFENFALPKIWQDKLTREIPKILARDGHLETWLKIFASTPDVKTEHFDFNCSKPKVGNKAEINHDAFKLITENLMRLQPWRKGPFSVFGIDIDSEWKSNLKWERLKNHISPLKGKRVLDVGCGNGYYILRMLGECAVQVTGIEPNLLYILQFEAIIKFLATRPNACILPVKLEDVPDNLEIYDSVFSMGVLYHRKSPFNHLFELKGALKPGGELILETLVVDGEKGYSLLPENRYAKMRNVWQIPSVPTLESWLKRTGFKDIKTISINTTDNCEQRKTSWMAFESLADFLDPQDKTQTIEGYPAPQRVICIARK